MAGNIGSNFASDSGSTDAQLITGLGANETVGTPVLRASLSKQEVVLADQAGQSKHDEETTVPTVNPWASGRA